MTCGRVGLSGRACGLGLTLMSVMAVGAILGGPASARTVPSNEADRQTQQRLDEADMLARAQAEREASAARGSVPDREDDRSDRAAQREAELDQVTERLRAARQKRGHLGFELM